MEVSMFLDLVHLNYNWLSYKDTDQDEPNLK